MTFKVGDIFADHYQLIKRLGAGSFGEVWLARNLLADINVAIKFYSGLDRNGISDFKEEFKLAYRLSHPNLLHMNHFDVSGQCPYLVMPYCANGSATLLRGSVSENRVWEFIRDVSAGLAYLHSQNPPIIHQDIKLANILIDENGRFIVTDFGISKKLEFHMQTFRSVKMESSGTIAYMSPERLKTPPVVVMASDMWSLGMSVYELVTGQVLWDLGGLMQLGGAEIPSLGGNYSSHLTRFFQRCLAVNPWERPKAHEAHEEAKAKLKGEVYQHPLVQSSLTASKTSLTSSSLQNSYSLNRETSSRSYTYSSYNRLDITKQKPDWWKKYGNILKWGGGAVLLFILALGVFLLLFSLDHDNQNDLNEVVPSNIEPTLGDSIFVDSLVVDSVVKPTQKSIRPAYRIKPKPVSVPSPKQTINREEELWKKCKSEDNVFLYDRYMNEYPKGKHVKEAQKRIQQLESILIGR